VQAGNGKVFFAGMDTAKPSGTPDDPIFAFNPPVTFTATVTDSSTPSQTQGASL